MSTCKTQQSIKPSVKPSVKPPVKPAPPKIHKTYITPDGVPDPVLFPNRKFTISEIARLWNIRSEERLIRLFRNESGVIDLGKGMKYMQLRIPGSAVVGMEKKLAVR